MSEVFYSRNLPRKSKFVAFDLATTLAIWTPTASSRIVLDGLIVSNNHGVGGTIAFYWGNLGNTYNNAILVLNVAGSSVVSPNLQPIENLKMDQGLYATPHAAGGTSQKGSWTVTATGVEIPLN